MEFLFHFVFTLVKISLQASLYALLLLLLARLYARYDADSSVARICRNASRFWWGSGAMVSGVLFLYSLTYWGDHGLGDYARIPLGCDAAIEQINGTMAYFEPVATMDQPEVVAYQLADDILCAQADDTSYFIYDLSFRRYQTFIGRPAYDAYAHSHGLPLASRFESFHKHYHRYWGGWRFWLLA
jgi:hypothetical protein